MPEISLHDLQELKNPSLDSFREIKPENGMSIQAAREFAKELFPETSFGGDYTLYSERVNRTPVDNTEKGYYEGDRGESRFIPSDATIEGATAKEKLNDYGLTGIDYYNAEADFSKCSEATVRIDNMTENRADNFSQADSRCAELWNESGRDGKHDWTPQDITNWRHENNCSWHERCDTMTMDLVPREIHDFFRHSGGVAECKARDKESFGGVFDE